MKTKILSLSLILTLCFFITSCTNNNTKNTNKSNNNASSTKKSAVNDNLTIGLNDGYVRTYYGYIGNDNRFQMDLTRNGNTLSGSYFYSNIGVDIKISGTIDHTQIKIDEFDPKGNLTGTFNGRFVSGEKIKGNWSKPDNSKVLPFEINELSINRDNHEDYLNSIELSDIEEIRPEKTANPKLARAIASTFDFDQETMNSSYYYYNYVDLNDDQKPEVIAFLGGPLICGTGGCGTFIFKYDGENFTLLREFVLTHAPIIVTNQRNNGWRSLIFRMSGGGILPYYCLVRYDGQNYPEDLQEQPKIAPNTNITGKAYLFGDADTAGIPLILNAEETKPN